MNALQTGKPSLPNTASDGVVHQLQATVSQLTAVLQSVTETLRYLQEQPSTTLSAATPSTTQFSNPPVCVAVPSGSSATSSVGQVIIHSDLCIILTAERYCFPCLLYVHIVVHGNVWTQGISIHTGC
jgi:hypothetical protein